MDPSKECGCGCAGIFCAPNTLECLATVFEEDGALDRLEAFVSLNGPAYYRLPVNEERVTLVRQDAPVDFPAKVMAGSEAVTVFDPMRPIHWNVERTACPQGN